MKMISSPFRNEDGNVLTIVLVFVGILILLGATATMITTTDTKIGANYRASEKALYVAEAGAQEARDRLRLSSTHLITDAHTNSSQWTAYVGSDPKAQKKGYDSGNAMHVRVASLQTDMDYTVVIAHQVDGSGNVLYWGDGDGDGDFERHTDPDKGENIYLINSYGNAEGGSETVQVEGTRVAPITVKAALYTGTSASILGSSTDIMGEDGCGGGTDLPGIATPQAEASNPVTTSGNPTVSGAGESDPSISYSDTPALDVEGMVDSQKGCADFSYTVNSATHTDSTTPGPGDGWGTPTPGTTPEDPSSCSECNIVHYDTQGTYIKLSGGVTGCGILLVEGDLEAHGGFSWYGPIIVTGSFTFTGGGDTNITGAVITGEDTDGDIIGGNTNIIYCSAAVDAVRNRSLPILNWKQGSSD
ncbi:MAG: pilus assembly PilX N-terminal domain-containing protein [Deltaproteobacteria bacterium]|nr:pilus assembly PilX N-terminal domain-containing protein [Deltaproteobacteria bacterium]